MSLERAILANMHEYVPGKSIEEVKAEYNLEEVIKLASNENPLGISRKAQQAIADTATKINSYPIGNSPLLLKKLSEKYSIEEKNLIFSNGSDEMIQMIATTYLNPGDTVLSSEHTFSEYEFATKLFDGTYIAVPQIDWNHDLEGIKNKIDSKTKLIFICNPNNPTGTWVPEAELLEFLDSIPKDIIVIVDQAYNEYATDPDYPSLITEATTRTNLILLRTFSKVYGLAGLRIGYAIAHNAIVSLISKVKQPFNVNLIAQAAALAVLDDTEFINDTLTVNIEGKEFLYEYLDSKNISYLETQGNFIAANVGHGAINIVKEMESKGVIIRSLKSFGMPEWVRITIGTKRQNTILIDIMNEVLA